MKNILVINVNWLGDAVFSLAVFGALRKAYPKAWITSVCVPRVAQVLQFSKDIDEIIEIDESRRHFWPWQKLAFIFQLRAKKYDVAFVLHPSLSRALIVWLSGIKERFGFCKWSWLMTKTVPNMPDGRHRMDHYLSVIESYGIKSIDRTYHLTAPVDDLVTGKYVVFNMGGNWDLKRWPKESWFNLMLLFKAENIRIVFTGLEKDRLDAVDIINKSGVKAFNLCGQTTVGQSLSVYAKATVVISADSGPLHLANSVGASVIGLFGATRQEITGPRGTGRVCVLFNEIGCNKTPCYHLGCLDNICMKGISAKDVFKAYKEITG